MPRLTVDLSKIEHNSRLVAELLAPHHVRLVGVTKACLGNRLVGEAMLAGGAAALADSRPLNIASLRSHLPHSELHLMCPYPASPNVAADADLFFVSSTAQVETFLSLSPEETPLKLCLMVETGDGREGVPPAQAADEAVLVAALEGAVLAGLATNAACARPHAPLDTALSAFAEVVEAICGELERNGLGLGGPDPALFSAGGSGLLALFLNYGQPDQPGWRDGGNLDQLFDIITDLRCGEAILLGRIPGGGAQGTFLPGAHRDAFVLEAPVLEVFQKNGVRQALVGIGVQDVGHGPLVSRMGGMFPARITSDYLAVNSAPGEGDGSSVKPGKRLSFIPTYYALLAAMTSPFVEKVFTR